MPYTQNAWLTITTFPETSKKIHFAVDSPFICKDTENQDILIGLQAEPDAILHHRQMLIDNHKNCDVILTYDDEILKACPNARQYVWGTTWISSDVYNNINIQRKQPRISCLTGSKELTPAHTYRKMLYTQQNSIPFLPIVWFRSSHGPLMPNLGNNPILGDSKVPLFLDYQYSVVIENCRENNYFTEKLMDCLLTKTIPIYYGCPNISNWFDTRGWIILETTSLQEFRIKCGKLPNYSAHINVINENFNRAKQYTNLENNIQRVMNFGN